MPGNPNYDALQHEVCVVRGWCGAVRDGKPSHVDHLIPDSGPVTADQFVEWLFVADGVDPSSEPEKWGKHKAGLREAFIRCMGSNVVDASALKRDVS